MRIVGVTMTYNDDYKLDEWKKNYLGYKDNLDSFIIVDNHSDIDYYNKVKKTFPTAIIIRRDDNAGCTGAYNTGIRYALENTDADAIVIIGNDIRTTPNCLPAMYDYLFSDDKLGIVSSAILYKDSELIDNYGHVFTTSGVINCNKGENINSIQEKSKYTDLVSGGFTMAKRDFYIKAGLQDENLFMYCDELDTMYKARKVNYKLGVIANEYAWHWHINNPVKGRSFSWTRYLICRNRIYIARKYEGGYAIFKQSFRGLFIIPSIYIFRFLRNRKNEEINDAWYCFLGAIHGILGQMNKLRLDK